MSASDKVTAAMHRKSKLLPGQPSPDTCARLVLADGTSFPGYWLGCRQRVVGELVFHTAMSGYQEILSDPSYAEQIVTFSYPHIGNTGMHSDDMESTQLQAKACILAQHPLSTAHWRNQQSFVDYCKQHTFTAMYGVDTRGLIRHLREHGSQAACMMLSEDSTVLQAAAQAEAVKYGSLRGRDLSRQVSCKSQLNWCSTLHPLLQNTTACSADAMQAATSQSTPQVTPKKLRVVVLDYGVKHNILRTLTAAGCEVICMPAHSSADAVLALQPAGVVLSNGPGDPAACKMQQGVIKTLLTQHDLPMLGICLGFQLLALATGARSYKMRFGHHGANHPVGSAGEAGQGRVLITSQNHGFAIDAESLAPEFEITHCSLFDGSLQGIRHRQRPILGVQGHPEASPGPLDFSDIFSTFIGSMQHAKTS